MTDEELIERIRYRRNVPELRTSMGTLEVPQLFEPVSVVQLDDAERRLGFALPVFLRRLYLEVGNGGFGPGYGLWGVAGGHPPYSLWAGDEADIVGAYLGSRAWPEGHQQATWRLLSMCDWGCGNFSAIDCDTAEGDVFFEHDDGRTYAEGISFRQYMEDWVSGVDLWKRARGED